MKDKMTKAIHEIEQIKNKERSQYNKREVKINTDLNILDKWSSGEKQICEINHFSKNNIIKSELIKSRELYEHAFKTMAYSVSREQGENYKKEMKSMMEAYRYGVEAIQEKINNEKLNNKTSDIYDRRIEVINSIMEAQKNSYYDIQKNAAIAISEAKRVVDVQKNAMKTFSKINLDAINKPDDFLVEARKNAANKLNEYLIDGDIDANKFKLINNAKNASNKIIKEAMVNAEIKKASVKAINEINRALVSQKKAIKAMINLQKDTLNIREIAKKNIYNRTLDNKDNSPDPFLGGGDFVSRALLLELLDRLYSNEITIGEVVKELRVNCLKISQDEFGKITKTSRKTISDFENNAANISENKIKEIIKPFGLKLTLMPL